MIEAPVDSLIHAKVGDSIISRDKTPRQGTVIGTKGQAEVIIATLGYDGQPLEHPCRRDTDLWRLDLTAQAEGSDVGDIATLELQETVVISDFAGEAVLEDVSIDLIDVDVQTRTLRPERIPSLMESIRVGGLQQPIVVFRKPVLGEAGKALNAARYTLGPGRHRLEAFKAMGRKTIPAMVHGEADSQTIRRAQVIENFHREDNTPIEDAEQCQFMLDDVMQVHGIEDETQAVKIAAGKIGADVRWFNKRLALNRLSPRVKQLLLEGQIYIGHAEHLAELVDHQQQEEIAGRVKARSGHTYAAGKHVKGNDPPKSIELCRELVRAAQADLRNVPWKLDVEFGGKPACTSCLHNAANAPGLFEGAPPAKCLLPSCFAEKRKLALSGVRKASNTLVKLGLPKSPKRAAEAMAERKVEFVKPAAVVTAAKNAMPATAGKKASKPSKAEKSGERKQAVKEQAWMKAVSAWDREVAKWRKATIPAVKKALTGDRKALLALILRACHTYNFDREPSRYSAGTYSGTPGATTNTRSIAGKLLSHMVDPKPAAFVEAAKQLSVPHRIFERSTYNRETWLLGELARLLGVKADPPPVFVEPKPEKPAAKPSKKKPAKKKTKKKAKTKGKGKAKVKTAAGEEVPI